MITSRRLVSFDNRHVAAISYSVRLLNAAASLVIASEMAVNEASVQEDDNDPRRTQLLPASVLHHKASYAKDRRIVLCHGTEKSRLMLACAADNALETSCPYTYKVAYNTNFGQVAFAIEASRTCPSSSPNTWFITRPRRPRSKSSVAAPSGQWIALSIRASPSSSPLSSGSGDDFWHRSDVRVKDINE